MNLKGRHRVEPAASSSSTSTSARRAAGGERPIHRARVDVRESQRTREPSRRACSCRSRRRRRSRPHGQRSPGHLDRRRRGAQRAGRTPGTTRRRDSMPSISDRPRARERRHDERHGDAMIPGGPGGPARQARPRRRPGRQPPRPRLPPRPRMPSAMAARRSLSFTGARRTPEPRVAVGVRRRAPPGAGPRRSPRGARPRSTPTGRSAFASEPTHRSTDRLAQLLMRDVDSDLDPHPRQARRGNAAGSG